MSNPLPPPFPEPQLKRVSLHAMGASVMAVLNLERGILYTFWQMIKSPGEAMRSYLFTDRSHFLDPLKFLVIGVAAYLFVSLKFFPDGGFFGGFAQGFSYSTPEPDDLRAANQQKIMGYLKDYANLMMLLTVPISAVISWRLFRRYQLYFGEHLAINAFLYGFLSFVAILFLPFDQQGYALMLFYLIYITYFLRSLFQMRWGKSLLYSFLFNALSMVGSMVFIGLAMGVLILTLLKG